MEISIWLLLIAIVVNSQKFDESFRAFCSRAGAPLISVAHTETAPQHGDKCTVNWGFWARDEEEAKEICKDMGVFHLSSWKRDSNGYALCEYEAIFICKPSFIQIRGKCYKVVKNGELRKRSEAESDCKAEKLKVFTYFDETIARIISEFFKNLEGIWAALPDGAELEVFYDEEGKGTNYMVAYGNSYWFGLGYGSLVKVGDGRLANVLCEYTPRDTALAFKANLEKIKSYIFPAHSTGVRTFWRTFNYNDHRWYGFGNSLFRTPCQLSMKPLLNSKMGSSLDPTRVIMDEMPEELKKSLPMAVVPFGDCLNSYLYFITTNEQNVLTCGERVRSQRYNVDCDGNCPLIDWMFTYFAIYHQNGKDYSIFKGRKGYAPYWCDIDYRPPKEYKPCPDGWITYEREDGWMHCHIHVDQKLTYNDAANYCVRKFQAEVSSFAERDEYNILKGMGNGWINALKTESCTFDSYGRCSKYEVFSFRTTLGDVSYEGRYLLGELMAPGHPTIYEQSCLHIQSDGLHDSNCYTNTQFFCGKEAEELK